MAGRPWWQREVIYQIYPRSFQDSNGDGVGDLPGIIRRLPHLRELGVGALWLSPIFPSPMADFGYDIADYCDIDPLFGTLADLDRLVEAAHGCGLKLLLDLVPNHTSDRHPWFIESRSSRTSPKRDWYIWRDPAEDGGPPNNWMSQFGGSAWQWDEPTGQYYYHAFLKEQPDLNWRNPAVAAAIHDVMRFWFGRGIDGFRIDVIWHLIKDDQFRDNPPDPDWPGDPPHQRFLPLHTTDLPEVHDVIAGLRRVAEEFPGRLLIGEIYLPLERLVAYYGRELRGVHLPFNFSLLEVDWHARTIGNLIEEYESLLPAGGWPNWVLSNHDRPRIASRVGVEQARVAAMLLLSLRGTPTVYYADEIGMTQVPIPPERVQDPYEKNVPGRGLGRDGARTPMQWDDSEHAGFSTALPWLPLADDYRQRNVAAQRRDEGSIYTLYRRLIAARREREALTLGDYRAISSEGDLLLFVRSHGSERLLIALNFGGEPVRLAFEERGCRGRILISTLADRPAELVENGLELRGHEGLLIELAPDAVVPRAARLSDDGRRPG
jgi:alpha-glucosidase